MTSAGYAQLRDWLYRCFPLSVGLAAIALSACAAGSPIGESEPGAEEPVWILVPRSLRGSVGSALGEQPRVERMSNAGIGFDEPLDLISVPTSSLGDIARALHAERLRCGGFASFATRAEALQAAAEFIVPPAFPPPSYALDNPKLAETLLAAVDERELLATIQGLSSFPTRYYKSLFGKQAAEWLRDRWHSYIGNRTDARVELWSHAGWTQPSVVFTIDGSNSPNEVVVIGGHLDSIVLSASGGSAPGADDDASGVATLGEVARVALTHGYRPARTVKFIAYAAEEVGLRGSKEIAQKFARDKVHVVGALQLDMTNFKGASRDVYVVQDYSNPEQNQFLLDLLSAYLPDLSWAKTKCGYACSDHASWNKAGYRASIPFEATMEQANSHIHSSGDTLDVSGNNARHAIKFARLAAAYVAELAEGTL
jgi:leucyl aminopeptidase